VRALLGYGAIDPIEKVRRLIKRKDTEKERLLKEISRCGGAMAPLA